ncbi:MAG: tetratricopeptide repeat protein [Deltaproteobacteria bacterium]|nr:tetratricopeptide repeat protein [Deltaproteobacteria bacterium]
MSSLREVEPDEALSQIQNFLKIYPEFAQAHNDLAVLYYQAGNGLKALAHYEKAHKLDPRNITFRKNLADFYFVELEWADDAIHTYLDILKDNPFDVETLNALGTISTRIGRREQARQYFSRTLQLDAVNSQARQALQNLGGALPEPPQPARISSPVPQAPAAPPVAVMPQPPVAPTQKAPVFQEPPKSPEQLHRQALELANSGKNSEARRALQDLLARYPEYTAGHNDLGVLCQQDGDIAQARSHHEEAFRLQPGNLNFRKNLADLLYIACGETEEALKLYLQILGGNPRDIETLKALSNISLEVDRPDDARSFLESILKIEPWNREARESLAAIADAVKKVQPAPAAVRSADEIYAEAQRLVQQDRLSEAHSLLEELAHNYSSNALFHNDLGVLRYRIGDIEGARRAYERAVELQPANSNFRKNLADLYFAELGMTDEAIQIYLDLHRKQPRDVETLAGLGMICTAVGHPEEAKSFYRRALEIEPWNADVRKALQGL